MTLHCQYARLAVLLLLSTVSLLGRAYTLQLSSDGYPRLEINGSSNLSYNVSTVGGSQSYYQDDNFDRQKSFTQNSNLHITGQLLPDLQLNAVMNLSLYTPDTLHWNLRYDGGSAKLLLGEFPADLGGNEFVLLNRTLTGLQVDPVLPKGSLRFITSKLKSPVRTDTFYGRNVSGPYYLTATPIVDGSEVVLIGNTRKERTKDYTLDYYNGIVTFAPEIIVSPAERITVSYEVAVQGIGGGQLYGVRATYPILPNLNVGITHLQVEGKGASSTEREERDQFLGNASPGPFYLTYRPIVADSEIVTINGALQTRTEAYTLEYATGKLLFKSGYEPPYSTTVIIRYRVQQTGSSSSDRGVTGIDLNWASSHGLAVRVQAARSAQDPTRTIAAEQVRNEPFTVAPGIPITQQVFRLRKAPVQAGTDVVRAGAQQLIRDQDYTLNDTTGELRLLINTIPISPTGPSLYVSYTSQPRQEALEGNSAVAVQSTYAHGRVAASLGFRQVDPGFTPLEMVGYRNTSRAWNWTGGYTFSDDLSFSLTGEDVRQPYNPYSSSSSSIIMHEQNRSYMLDFHRPNWPSVSLRRTTTDSQQEGDHTLGNASSTDSLMLAWTKNPITASLNLMRAATDSRQLRYTLDPYAPVPDNPDPSDPVYTYKGTTDNASLNLMYQPNDRLSVGMNLAKNNIATKNDGKTINSGGDSMTVNATYRPVQALTLTASARESNTDAATSVVGSDIPALTNRNLSLGANWQASQRMSFGVNYTNDHAEGGDSSNSSSNGLSANLWWQPLDQASLNGYWSSQGLHYLGAQGDSRSNMVGVSAQIGPIKKATVSLDAQHIWGENSFGVTQLWQSEGVARRAVPQIVDTVGIAGNATGNKLTTLAARVSYPIANKQELFVSGETTQSSGFPSESTKHSVGLGWNYRLNDNLTLTLGGQRVIYSDSATPDLNYNANQFNADLSWQF